MYQRQVTFTEAIRLALQNHYCDFEGRSSRSEFWWFFLFTNILSAAITLIFGVQSVTAEVLNGLIGLLLLLPSLGLAVRRLHDVGKSGWWLFIALIPLVGVIYLIYLYCQPSMTTPNEYGAEPNVVA